MFENSQLATNTAKVYQYHLQAVSSDYNARLKIPIIFNSQKNPKNKCKVKGKYTEPKEKKQYLYK